MLTHVGKTTEITIGWIAESGIFNVNVYIDMKAELNFFVYFIKLLLEKSLYAWSLRGGEQIFFCQVCFYKSYLLRRTWRSSFRAGLR